MFSTISMRLCSLSTLIAPALFAGGAMAAEPCPCFTAADTAACDIGGLGPVFTVLGEYAGDDKSIVVTCGDLRAEHPLYSVPDRQGGCANFASGAGYRDVPKDQASACVSLLGNEWMKRKQ